MTIAKSCQNIIMQPFYWHIRNGACFMNIIPVDPVSVIAKISRYIHHWAGLQKKELQDEQYMGAKTLLSVAKKIFRRSKGWSPGVRRLADR
jgi:hypothetical protein